MGIQDRDYYRDHHRDLERRNDAWLSANTVSPLSWLARFAVVALICVVVYLGYEVVHLRGELAKAERVVEQLTAQMRADRQRAARPPPPVQFFNR